jgi:large subunit ribosomal protein L3
MSLGILGRKIGMTRVFDSSGNTVPVTAILVGPCIVTDIKTLLKNGYNAIQIGYENINLKKVNKPELGSFLKSKIKPLKYLKEFSVTDPEIYKLGQEINISMFKDLTTILSISGMTSGKGFSGLQKKHNFQRGPMSHGSKSHRAPGSIGMGTTPGRVFPGKRISGQLGNKKSTIKNLKIISINSTENILIVKGSVPGKSTNLLTITFTE